MSINKVMLVGRLGAEPEMKTFSNGGMICNLTIATSENWKDKQTGERKERTEWHRCVLRDRLGEIAQQYLHKGSQVYIEGRIQTRKWQDQSGQDRYSTEIIVTQLRMLGSKSPVADVPTTAVDEEDGSDMPLSGDKRTNDEAGYWADIPF